MLQSRDDGPLERGVCGALEGPQQHVDLLAAEAVPVCGRGLAHGLGGFGRHEPLVGVVGRRSLLGPAERQREGAAVQALHPGAEVPTLHRRVDAQCPQVGGDDLGRPHPVRPARHDLELGDEGLSGGVAALPLGVEGPARGVEEFGGGGGIVRHPGALGGGGGVAPGLVGVGQARGVCGHGGVVHGDAHDELAVDGHADGATEIRVVEGRCCGVGVQEDGAAHQREPVVVVLGVSLHEDPVDGGDEGARPVDLTVDQGEVGGLVAGQGRHAQALDALGGLGVPVVRVPADVVDLGLEAEHLGEGARPHGIGVGVDDGIVDLGPDVLGHDGLVADPGQPRHEWLTQLDDHGVIVASRDRLHAVGEVVHVECLGVLEELEGEDHIVGRERLAVRPLHALAEREDEALARHLPVEGGRQPGLELAAQAVVDDQGLVDAAVGGPAVAAGHAERVEVADPGGLQLLDHHQGARWRLGLGAAGPERQGSEHQGPEQELSHSARS